MTDEFFDHTGMYQRGEPGPEQGIFNIDIEVCGRCGGSVKVISDASDNVSKTGTS